MRKRAEDVSLDEYKIFETDQFTKDLQRIARSGQQRLIQKLANVVYPQLRQHPHFGSNIKKLRDFSPETWRYRIGAWRFFYEINDESKIVSMVAASHWSDAY